VKDEDLLEVSTNKVNLKIAAPSTGKLIEILAQEGDVVTVGDVIALIEIINE
jgi:pyruvate/2-oxoglutarate dehydrogenase complex dihydrolipoamide acyltransferase (E2) component